MGPIPFSLDLIRWKRLWSCRGGSQTNPHTTGSFRRTNAALSKPAFATAARRAHLTNLKLAPRRRIEFRLARRRREEHAFTRRPVLNLRRRWRRRKERRERRRIQQRRTEVMEDRTGPVPPPCSPVLRRPRRGRRFDVVQRIVQQRNEAPLLSFALKFGCVFLTLSRDPIGPQLVDLVVVVSNSFLGLGRMSLGVGDLMGNVLQPLDKILQHAWRKWRQHFNPIP
jgi:hypothetical protein